MCDKTKFKKYFFVFKATIEFCYVYLDQKAFMVSPKLVFWGHSSRRQIDGKDEFYLLNVEHCQILNIKIAPNNC